MPTCRSPCATPARGPVQSEGDVFLATQEPQDNYYWCIQGNPYGSHSGNRVLLPHDVAPGAEVTFDFVVRPLGCKFSAPAPLRFRMLSQSSGTFGEETPDPMVGVGSGADYVSQQVPDRVPAGATVQFMLTFKNTSTATWNPADGYALLSASPTGNSRDEQRRVDLGGGARRLGDLQLFRRRAGDAGINNFQWQMSSGGAPFGKCRRPRT
jgi:hypothetical protein